MNRDKIELNFVLPSVTLVEEHDLVRKVERAYRVCYKSEDKMTDTSKDLVKRLAMHRHVKRHTSPLEHSCVTIKSTTSEYTNIQLDRFFNRYASPFLYTNYGVTDGVTGNFRAFHDFLIQSTYASDNPETWIITNSDTSKIDPRECRFYGDELDQFFIELRRMAVIYGVGNLLHKNFPEVFPAIELENKEKFETNADYKNMFDEMCALDVSECKDYYSFMIVTSRDILQELARHRALSPSVESTRYCNYGNKGYTFVIPKPYEWAEQFSWSEQDIATITYKTLHDSLKTIPRKDGTGAEYVAISPMGMIQDYENNMLELFLSNCYTCAARYDKALQLGTRPQEARMLMPGGLKTELMMSGYKSYWVNHFLPLRDDKDAHPMMQYIAHEISKLIL